MGLENDEHLDVLQNIEVGLKKEYDNNPNDLSLKEYVKRIDKVKRSVERHAKYGKRGYYEFIKNFL
ncbi:MAG: hypothetical protein R6U03_02725 [Gillisia sp.]